MITLPRLRLRRAVLRGAVILTALAMSAAVATPWILRGPRFGRVVERFLPDMRGKIQVGGGSWTWSALLAWARGRPAPFELTDVRITDPEGSVVLSAGRLSGRVVRGSPGSGVVVEDLVVEQGTFRFADMKNGVGVGFLAAFEPRARARPSASAAERRGAMPAGGPVLSLTRARLEGLTVTFDLYGWGLVLADVHGIGGLSVAPENRRTPLRFEVRDADVRGGGSLRVLRGTTALVLPFDRVHLDRVATTAESPDEILLQATGLATGRSRLSCTGKFSGVYGVSSPRIEPGIDLQATVMDAADALVAVTSSRGLVWPAHLAGPGARVELGFAGPFTHVRISAHASLASPDGGTLGADLAIDERALVLGLSFTNFTSTPLLPAPLVGLAGGTLQGKALGRFVWRTGIASVDSLALTLTRPLGGPRPRVVDLRLGAAATARDPATRTRGSGWGLEGPDATFSAGTLRLPRLSAELWGGRLSMSGQIGLGDRDATGALAAPRVDLMLVAERLSASQLVGTGFVEGELSLRARARGRLDQLAMDVVFSPPQLVRVLGQPYRLPGSVKLRLDDRRLELPTVRLRGPGGSVVVLGGSLDTSGRVSFDVGVRDFPFDRLPGLAGTALPLAGQLNGALTLSGEVGQPVLAGRVSFDSVSFQGRRVGGGLVTVSPAGPGAIRAHGHLVEGIEIDGTLGSAPGGLTAAATLVLRDLELDPFLPALPGGVTAAGVLSGSIGVHLAPGQTARAEGRLSALTLKVIPPGRAVGGTGPAVVRPLELHSEGEIHLLAQAGAGPIHLGPARFAGNLGTFEMEGQSNGEALSGTVRGRVVLDACAPVTAVWVEKLKGVLDVDLRLAQTSARDQLAVSGEIVVAKPLSGRSHEIPFATRIPSGRLRFLGNAIEIRSMPLTFEGGTSVPAASNAAPGTRPAVSGQAGSPVGAFGLGGMRGQANLSLRVSDVWRRPAVRAVLELGRLESETAVLGDLRVAATGGRIELDGRGITLRAIPVQLGSQSTVTLGGLGGPPGVVVMDPAGGVGLGRLDIPIAGELRALSLFGVRLDRAMMKLRLSGDLRRSILLSGEVQVVEAHVSSSAGLSAAPSPAGRRAPRSLPAELERVRLDLRIQSGPGAVHVDVPHVPDIRVGVDFQVGGTVASPEPSGRLRGAGVYSSLLLWLGQRLKSR